MNRRSLISLTALCLAGMTAVWLSAPPATPDHPTATAAAGDANSTARTVASPEADTEAAATAEEVAGILATWRGLHGPVGFLSQAETEALIAEREAAAEALAAAIAELSAAELEGVLAELRAAERSRDKLVMIEGLGRNPSTTALSILEEVYLGEDSYTLKRHVLRALGDSPAEGRHELLTEQMWDAGDERLQQLSAQALYGETVAVDALAEALGSDLPIKVRLEAVHSLGATGTEDARQALEGVIADEGSEPRMRAFARKELERSFG